MNNKVDEPSKPSMNIKSTDLNMNLIDSMFKYRDEADFTERDIDDLSILDKHDDYGDFSGFDPHEPNC